jgi:hypothetical protein
MMAGSVGGWWWLNGCDIAVIGVDCWRMSLESNFTAAASTQINIESLTVLKFTIIVGLNKLMTISSDLILPNTNSHFNIEVSIAFL